MSEILTEDKRVESALYSVGGGWEMQIEFRKLEIKGYNINIYSRHVQHELYNRLIHERRKVREMQVSWKPHQVS